MRIPARFQRIMALLLTLFVFRASSAFSSSPQNQSPQEQAEGYYWYEAVFLNSEEVQEIFGMVSGNYPKYEFVPGHFHVTTQYKPEIRHENLYGLPVTVHITGYVFGSVQDTQENLASDNEGLRVELSAADKELQDLIDGIEKNWHITGSYSVAAKYTGQLDFSGAAPVDITIEGVFGMDDSDGMMILKHHD